MKPLFAILSLILFSTYTSPSQAGVSDTRDHVLTALRCKYTEQEGDGRGGINYQLAPFTNVLDIKFLLSDSKDVSMDIGKFKIEYFPGNKLFRITESDPALFDYYEFFPHSIEATVNGLGFFKPIQVGSNADSIDNPNGPVTSKLALSRSVMTRATETRTIVVNQEIRIVCAPVR